MTAASMLLSPPPLPSQAAVDRPTQKHLRGLYLSLRRGELRGSTDVALATAKALRRVISGARFTVLEELNNTIRITGAWLQEARRGGE
jgi:translation initiation factor 2B subunit (eIF-2B alpha/beta/delta family)